MRIPFSSIGTSERRLMHAFEAQGANLLKNEQPELNKKDQPETKNDEKKDPEQQEKKDTKEVSQKKLDQDVEAKTKERIAAHDKDLQTLSDRGDKSRKDVDAVTQRAKTFDQKGTAGQNSNTFVKVPDKEGTNAARFDNYLTSTIMLDQKKLETKARLKNVKIPEGENRQENFKEEQIAKGKETEAKEPVKPETPEGKTNAKVPKTEVAAVEKKTEVKTEEVAQAQDAKAAQNPENPDAQGSVGANKPGGQFA